MISKNFQYQSAKSPDEFLHRLERNLYPEKDFKIFDIRKPNVGHEFEGNIHYGTFKFRRILKQGANSFINLASGTVRPTEVGSAISVTAKLQKVTSYFLLYFLTFFTFMAILTFIFDAEPKWLIILPILMGLAFYIVAKALFLHESRKVDRFIKSLL